VQWASGGVVKKWRVEDGIISRHTIRYFAKVAKPLTCVLVTGRAEELLKTGKWRIVEK